MAATLEVEPSPSSMSQPWRKRPAHMTMAGTHHPSKRQKQASTNSSSESVSVEVGGLEDERSELRMDVDTDGRKKAERWFNHANDRPGNVSFVDNDPPFYMPTQSSKEASRAVGNTGLQPPQEFSDVRPTAPTRSLLAQMDAQNDGSDDFRSVIDDLTVQNKKLKRKLRQYEKLHCSHLQEEKLFEVRIHGLPANRKKQLEETLRSFASSMQEESGTEPTTNARRTVQAVGPSALGPSMFKPSSSSTSLSKPQDSGYASNSGVTGASHAQASEQQQQPPTDGAAQAQRQNQNVKSFLHDIPENLAPKSNSSALSDRTKSKLVVKRLEQLFTGRGARTRHNQSQQQEEVSQSAAQADRRQNESDGKRPSKEGTREAHILPDDAELQMESMEDVSDPNKSRSSNEGSRTRHSQEGQNGSGRRSPEQRPTRPLDLDLHRASVPSDNMDYIRHLGLVSAETNAADKDVSTADGWVYLNLLNSMAQLHTLNVTPEFIRKAIADVSEKFELSKDGSKLRWLGGNDGTRLSSDSGDSDEQTKWNSSNPSLSNGQRGSFAENSSEDKPEEQKDGVNAVAANGRRRPMELTHSYDTNSFHYRPLFLRHQESEESDNSGLVSDSLSSSEVPDFTTGMNSGSNALREREAKLRGRRRDNGPIIFYNRARFCTDLSGDAPTAQADPTAYRRLTEQPVGCPRSSEDNETSSQSGNEAHSSSPDTESMDVAEGDGLGKRSALNLEDLKSSISDCLSSNNGATAMEASGLGGVRPEDNFVLKVQVRHAEKRKGRASNNKLSSFSKPKGPVRKFLHNIPQKSVDAFREKSNGGGSPGRQTSAHSSPSNRQIQTEILTTRRTNLAPSALPPPSFVHLPFTSSESDDEESSGRRDVDFSSPEEQRHLRCAPTTTQGQRHQDRNQRLLPPSSYFLSHYYHHDHPRSDQLHYSTDTTSPSKQTTTTSGGTTGSGSSGSSSIDLLAHARELDPDTIAAREREFDRNRNGTGSDVTGPVVSGPQPQSISQQGNPGLRRQAASSAATYGGESAFGERIRIQGGEPKTRTIHGNNNTRFVPDEHQRNVDDEDEDDDEDGEDGDGDEDSSEVDASEVDSMSVDRESGGDRS